MAEPQNETQAATQAEYHDLPEEKVKQLIELMNSTTDTKIPAQKEIIACFRLAMDEQMLDYLIACGPEPVTKDQLEEEFCILQRQGVLPVTQSWESFWAEIMDMSFMMPLPDRTHYQLASIFPGWIELSVSGPLNPKRRAILNRFMDFWVLLRKLNVAPLRLLTNMKGVKSLQTETPHMGTLTSVVTRSSSKRPAEDAAAVGAVEASAPQDAFAQDASTQDASPSKRTIQVNKTLTSEHQMLTKGSVFELIARHKDELAVMNCFCRQYKQMNGGEACHHHLPLESCLSMGVISRQLVENGVARHVDYDEAVAMMEEFERNGCIHTTFHYGSNADNEAMVVCNCCVDCCLLYGGYQQGYMSKIFVKAFNRPELVDAGACTGCNQCGLHCPSDAMRYNKALGRLEFMYENCVGCGQCVTQCRFGVHRMVPDERPVFVKTKKPAERQA